MSLAQIKLEQLLKAFSFLEETLQQPKTRITVAATVQAFEMALELSWKWLKFILSSKGVEGTAPKEIVRLAGFHGLINNVEEWLSFLEARNLTSHTYNDETAKQVYDIAMSFKDEVSVLKKLGI